MPSSHSILPRGMEVDIEALKQECLSYAVDDWTGLWEVDWRLAALSRKCPQGLDIRRQFLPSLIILRTASSIWSGLLSQKTTSGRSTQTKRTFSYRTRLPGRLLQASAPPVSGLS